MLRESLMTKSGKNFGNINLPTLSFREENSRRVVHLAFAFTSKAIIINYAHLTSQTNINHRPHSHNIRAHRLESQKHIKSKQAVTWKKQNMKVKAKANWSLKTKLGLPVVFLACLFFFLAGLLGSALVSQRDSSVARPRGRVLELVKEEYDLMPPGETGDDSLTEIPFQVLSWMPRALYFPNFATAEQCKRIINMAEPSLRPSTLALRKGETVENTQGIRTSSGMFISAAEDETGTLDIIEEKIARATMLPRIHGEAFNVLRYEVGQRYNSHYDAFNPDEYGPQKSQRVASFLLYLSDVEEGGETMFPFENGQNMDGTYDYQECIGLKVKPHRGDGLLFYSLLPNGTIDPTSLHGSCPVITGQKWVATKWIRDQEQYD